MADSTWIDWLKNPPKAPPSQQKTPRQRTARVNLMNADIARPTAWTVGATPRADPAGTLAAPSATPGSTKHHRQEQLGASGHSRSRSPAVILLSYSTVHAMPRTSRAQEHKDNKWHFRAPPTQTPRLPAPPAVPARRSTQRSNLTHQVQRVAQQLKAPASTGDPLTAAEKSFEQLRKDRRPPQNDVLPDVELYPDQRAKQHAVDVQEANALAQTLME